MGQQDKSAENGAKTDRQRFLNHLEWASRIVKTWPAWKRNILKNSSKSTLSTPRKPVLGDWDA